ncbi:MAG: hypothetical protein ACYS8Y_05995 [Planctomycetota bacterium]
MRLLHIRAGDILAVLEHIGICPEEGIEVRFPESLFVDFVKRGGMAHRFTIDDLRLDLRLLCRVRCAEDYPAPNCPTVIGRVLSINWCGAGTFVLRTKWLSLQCRFGILTARNLSGVAEQVERVSAG